MRKNRGGGEASYEDIELCTMIADKTKNFAERLKKKPYALNGTNIFLSVAIYDFLINSSAETINIIDFGGACGAHYFESRRFFPSRIKFRWHVVETSEMVKAAKNSRLGNDELYFYDDMDTIKSEIDFIHSSGALQYVSDYSQYLLRLMEFDAKYMLFNRMMFNENDFDFVTVQKSKLSANGPGPMPEKYDDKDIFYPHTTISYKKFSEILKKKYEFIWEFDEPSGSYRINDEKITGKGMLYINRSHPQ
jgi:putative methyltransferase (TIGR04325 family)